MRIQMFMLCAAVAAMMAFSPMSRAECDSKCQAGALDVGSTAAREAVFAEVVRGGRLGILARTEAILNACGDKGKASAIRTVRFARLKSVVQKRLDQPLGSENDSPEAAGLQAGALAYTAEALQLGYLVGYSDMVESLFATDKTARKAMCSGTNKLADELLFGDKAG